MKRIILIAALVLGTMSAFAQWQFTQSTNKFDDFQYKAAYVQGKGDFPYTTPLFFIRQTDRSEALEIMMAGIAYTSEGSTIKVYIDDGKVYSFSLSVSSDGQTIWLDVADEKDAFLNELKNGSKLYTRVSNTNGNESYEFSLSGSTTKINKVIN